MTAITTFVVGILFVSVSLRSTVGHLSNDDLQQKYDVVVDEIGDLRETMIQMREDMKEMKKISKALNNLCAELQLPDASTDPAVHENEPGMKMGGGSKGEDEQDDKDNKIKSNGEHLKTGPFQIYSVEVSNGTYRIEYDESITGEEFFTENETPSLNMTSMEPEKLYSSTKGIITGSVTPGSNYISIMAGEFTAAISFDRNNQTPSKIDLEPLEFNSSLTESITFEPGNTIEIKVTLSKDQSNNFDMGMYTPFKDGTVIFTMSDLPGIVNISAKEEYSEYNEISITVNGDKEDHDGLVLLSLSTYKTDVKGLDYMFYSVAQLLEVRRSDHKEPFEVGYIGFVKFEFMDFDQTCRVGKTCIVRLSLVGNRPKDVTLWRKLEGEKTQLKVPKQRGDFSRYILSVLFYLPNPSTEDEGRYIFRGTSHNGTVIEREFKVTVEA